MEQIFEQMRRIVEAPDYPLLKSYTNDFYVIDREVLERTFTPGQEYVWLVRNTGTELSPIGINHQACAFLLQPFQINLKPLAY